MTKQLIELSVRYKLMIRITLGRDDIRTMGLSDQAIVPRASDSESKSRFGQPEEHPDPRPHKDCRLDFLCPDYE